MGVKIHKQFATFQKNLAFGNISLKRVNAKFKQYKLFHNIGSKSAISFRRTHGALPI